MLGQYTEAVASFDKVLAINPNDIDAIQNRKNALEKHSQAQTTSTPPIQQLTSTTPIQQPISTTPVPTKTQQQTKTTPLMYAPIGAIILIIGIAVWCRHRSL